MVKTYGGPDPARDPGAAFAVRPPGTEELLCLAIIRVTDLIVERAYHGAYPHQAPCRVGGCVMRRFQSWRTTHGQDLGLVTAWRRDVMFDLPVPRSRLGRARLVVRLREGTPLWEVEHRTPATWGLLWGHLDRFARQLGFDPAAEMAAVRRTMAVSLACLLPPADQAKGKENRFGQRERRRRR